MSKKLWVLIVLIIIASILIVLFWLKMHHQQPITPSYACTPDVPVSAGLLSSPPTDLANVDNVAPLGSLNPGGGHVLPTDHMYLAYPGPSGHGSNSYPVYNMADGQLFMLFRHKVASHMDYQIFIRHTCSVYSYFDHLQNLGNDIETYLTSNNVVWYDLSGKGNGPWVAPLGQDGEPDVMSITSGDQVGTTHDYSYSWDVGLVDTRQTNGVVSNPSPRHYPSFNDFASLYPALKSKVDISRYHMGNKQLNAACFIDYMDNSSGMQADWRAKLASHPPGCGTVGWDTPGHLRGTWFNPELDKLPGVVPDYEVGAFSIIPNNFNPGNQIQVGIGNAANGTSVPNLALVDPVNHSPSISAPQIRQPLFADIDTTAGTVVDPDPAEVEPGLTVCYDLRYNDKQYNTLLLHMTDSTHLKIKYNPSPQSEAQCKVMANHFPPVDSSWVGYIR